MGDDRWDMFTLGQLVEKRLEVQGEMALGFVHLEKAYDTVPIEMVMATLRWMMYADDLAVVVESRWEMQEVLGGVEGGI